MGATSGAVRAAGGHEERFAATERRDAWWVGPLLTALGLGGFTVYVAWRALQGADYWADPYLSPLYSPLLFANPAHWPQSPVDHAWFGAWPAWWPSFLPPSPAFLILIVPGSFRATCYYYRKAYYRSFLGTPPGCAVCPVAQNYRGETRLFVFQNLHRYALYAAVALIAILYYDAFHSLFQGVERRFGIGVGSAILFVNATLLAGYTFGCHSFRHLIGGRKRRFAARGRRGLAYRLWRRATWLNERHMLFAWLSLFWVGFTDFYVYLLATGTIRDWNTWGT